MQVTPMNHWYLEWFNQDYLEIYHHRNAEEANIQVDFILSNLGRLDLPWMSTTPQVLDIACGAGRHLLALSRRGAKAYGIDRSLVLLKQISSDIPHVVADMAALPFSNDSFHLALSMFTSFGYFSSDSENLRALDEWHRVLRPDGILVLDYFNSEAVVANLVSHSEKIVANRRVTERRTLSADGKRIEKAIIVSSHSKELPTQEYRESVRLFSPTELRDLVNRANMTVVAEFGDFTEKATSRTRNDPPPPRHIIFAKKLSLGSH